MCYLNEETQETTWKHPFYDYFAQLMDHCKRSSNEEHIKLRLNRLSSWAGVWATVALLARTSTASTVRETGRLGRG